MRRTLLPALAALAACTPPPQDAAMRKPGPTPAPASAPAVSAPVPASAAPDGFGPQDAALGPVAVPVSAAENALPTGPADTPAEALGRRTLSTAFVMIGPDGHLTAELRDGRVLVLRDVVMRPKDYCGVQVRGGKPGARFCGGYADVASARPGGGPPLPPPGGR